MHGMQTRRVATTPQGPEHERPSLVGQLDLVLPAPRTGERPAVGTATGAPALVPHHPLVARTKGPRSTPRASRRAGQRDAAVPRSGRDAQPDSVDPPGPSVRPLLMSVSEAARVLRIGRRQAWEMVWRGELPVIRLGPRTLRIHHRVLDEFLLERSRPYAG